MIDKKQVMFDIERCISHVPDACRDCSKYKGVDGLRCMEELMADAYALLKEKVAVRPIKKDTVAVTARYGYECLCGAPLLIGQPYCANCGSEVKWE